MLRSIQQLFGDKLGASDGEIGHVKDCYFDDRHWAVRYVVADTGSWIPGRQVLISPHAFGHLPQPEKVLPVNLTRKQIEKSPEIESHRPVSRQDEEEYHQHYGWPYYWQGEDAWGMTGFPMSSDGVKPFSAKPPGDAGAQKDGPDAHLRSVFAVLGYQIQAGEETVGHVSDFMMDEQSWVIRQLVINTGNRFTGKKVLLSPCQVVRISREESKVFVNSTRESILLAPVYKEEAASVASIVL